MMKIDCILKKIRTSLLGSSLLLIFLSYGVNATEVPCPPWYTSNTAWWMYQFEGYPDFTNANCGPTCSGMVINYLKDKRISSSYHKVISDQYPNVHAYTRWNYCKGNGHPNGYENSDWNRADFNEIMYALSSESIQSHQVEIEAYNESQTLSIIEEVINQGKLVISLVS